MDKQWYGKFLSDKTNQRSLENYDYYSPTYAGWQGLRNRDRYDGYPYRTYNTSFKGYHPSFFSYHNYYFTQ